DFSLNVVDNTVASSEVVATKASLKGNLDAPGNDAFTYTGVLDTKGDTRFNLAGSTFTLRMRVTSAGSSDTKAANVYTGTFDDKGNINAPSAGADLASMSVSLDPVSGALNIRLSGATLVTDPLTDIGTLVTNTKDTYKVRVILCMEFRTFRTCDVLDLIGPA